MISFIDIKLIVLKSCLYLFSPKSTYTCGGSDAFSDNVYWLFFPNMMMMMMMMMKIVGGQ